MSEPPATTIHQKRICSTTAKHAAQKCWGQRTRRLATSALIFADDRQDLPPPPYLLGEPEIEKALDP
ncbi:hypothetical protein BC360_26895 [Ensifer sp. LC163]|nr:hypothetical protein BC360_26895 [Ensifer sp. LC163]